MMLALVILGTLCLFTAAQAAYWRVLANRAKSVDLLRARLRVSADEGLMRSRDQEDSLAVLLLQSGLGWTKTDFVRRVAIAAVGLGLLGALRNGFGAGVAMSLVAAGGMYAYVVYKRDKRIQLVAQQMPRALDLMTLTLRAGHALQRAVAVVADEMPAPTGQELRRVAEETELGRPIEEAFVAMNRRLPGVPPLRALVTGILVLGKTGGNLIEVLDRVVDFSSQQSQFQARVRALTAENRASGFILAALPPGFATLATLMNRNYFNTLVDAHLGRVMVLLAFSFWLAGVLWIRRMARVED